MRVLGGWFGRLSPQGHPESSTAKKPVAGRSEEESFLADSIHWQATETVEPGGGASDDESGAAALLTFGYADPSAEGLARQLMAKFPEADTAYCWLGHHYGLRGRFDEARAVLDEGLAACARKRRLCREYGRLELEACRLPEAVKWWLRAATLQARGNSLDDHEPFLFLAYVAGCCGLADQARQLFAIVDRIQPARLSPAGQAELHTLVDQTTRRPLVKAIEAFVQSRHFSLLTTGCAPGSMHYDKRIESAKAPTERVGGDGLPRESG